MKKITMLSFFAFVIFLVANSPMIGLVDAANEIRIGVIGPMTGPAASVGLGIQKASILAADEINAGGGILGKKVKLFFGDTESKPAAGVAVVERLIVKDKAQVITGGLHTDVALAAMEVPARYGVPYIITGPASDSISKKIADNMKKFRFTYKTDPAIQKVTAIWAAFADEANQKGFLKLKTRKIAAVVENTDYGRVGADGFKNEAERRGFKSVASELVDIKHADYMPILSKIKRLEPDIIFSIQTSPAAAVALLKQFIEIGIPAHFFAWYASANPDYQKLAGSHKTGIITNGNKHQFRPGPESERFVNDFKKRWGFMPSMVPAWQYDVIYMVKVAFEKAQSTDSEKFAVTYGETDYTGVAQRYVYQKANHEAIAGAEYFMIPCCQYWEDEEILVYPFERAEGNYRTPPWVK